MRKPRCDGQETRRRLLESAAEVFAERGFHDATISEICSRAQTNSAAVNYYFSSKEYLYTASWRYAFDRALIAHPPDGGVALDASPEDRLAGRISSLMHRIADEDSHSFDIVHKELASPTGLLVEATRASIEPLREGFSVLVAELLGKSAATEENIRLCRMSIMSQCFGPLLRRRQQHLAKEPSGIYPDHSSGDVEELARHVHKFSLAGIRAIRESDSNQEPRA